MKRSEKEATFRDLYKQILHITECGTWEDLVKWRHSYIVAHENGALLKGDEKILDKNDVMAERRVMAR